MAQPKLSKLELQILEALWAQGKASIREIQEAFPEPRPAYTTIQTTVCRLEGKQAVRRVRKIVPQKRCRKPTPSSTTCESSTRPHRPIPKRSGSRSIPRRK